jgi:hypothetical protein
MILKPYSYNGTSLQSTFKAVFPRENGQAQVISQSGYVKRAGAPPVYAGKDITPKTLVLEITMPSVISDLDTLNQLFDTQDETPRQFICTDEEDSSKQYYVYATPQQVSGGHDGTEAVVMLALDDPIWQTVTQTTQAWSITSSTSTTDVTINTNADAYPIFEITPTSNPSTDFIYSMYIQVLPTGDRPWNSRPLCITGDTSTTWDTAALVAAGKMQADGDDIRVYRNGIEQNYWLSGINTTDTKVWVVADMGKAVNFTTSAAIGATDTVTEIQIPLIGTQTALERLYGENNQTKLNNLPPTGLLIVDTSLGSTDTEEFIYSAVTRTERKLAFTIRSRANRNTLAVAHAAGSNVRYMPYGYRIDYGASSAVAATVDDATKPLINLSTSNNTSFVYSTFYDTAGLRAGRWQPFVRQQSDPTFSRSGHFTSTSDEGDTDPATEMGLKALTYQRDGTWKPDTVLLTWVGNFPDYVTSFSASGEQNQTASTIPTAGMAWLNGLGTINYFWTVTAQASTDYGTFTTWTKATTDANVPLGIDSLRWIQSGTILGTSDLYSKVGASSVTVNFTNNPHVMLRGETTATVKINCVIANTTTGDSIEIITPVDVNETIYIDTDPDFPTVTYNGQVINGALRLSSIRAAWLKLQPGANSLTFDNSQSVSNNFTINIKLRERANFF